MPVYKKGVGVPNPPGGEQRVQPYNASVNTDVASPTFDQKQITVIELPLDNAGVFTFSAQGTSLKVAGTDSTCFVQLDFDKQTINGVFTIGYGSFISGQQWQTQLIFTIDASQVQAGKILQISYWYDTPDDRLIFIG